MKVFVEGHGCAANLAETEQIKGFLENQPGTELVSFPSEADWLLVHSCGVKKSTEFKLQHRLEQLAQLNPCASVIVSGCLPKINPAFFSEKPRIVPAGNGLESIATTLGLSPVSFSPLVPVQHSNQFISVIPIATGCLGNCSFCGTKKAKGILKSHPIETIQQRFQRDLQSGAKEFRLVSQDNGCYGFDLKTSLPRLLETLLLNEGDFRIRIGMLSPQYLSNYLDEFVSLFADERLYRFLHLPVQSGNNRVLREMRRGYSVEEFQFLVKELRARLGEFSLALDIITGFPTETEEEFLDSVSLVQELRPDTVNVSRYGLRPGTSAAELPQLIEREKTNRSHFLARVCRNLLLEKNQELVGRKEKVLVSEKAKLNGFVARTNSYKPVVVPSANLGEFGIVRIEQAFPLFLKGRLLE